MFRNQPIKRKLMTVILLTSGVVLLLACGAFLTYDLLTFRQTMVRNLSTLAQVVAANSTAAVAFDNRTDATEALSALSAERHIVAAGLYDNTGTLFAKYPDTAPDDGWPARLERDGYQFARTHLVLQEPVVNASRRLGTLVLKSDLGAMYERLSLYGGLVVGVMVLTFLVAFPLSNRLQRHISLPVLALADTAKAVSEGKDYSVRAARFGDDELGQLADAFNDMLAQIQGQDTALRQREEHLHREVAERQRAQEEIRAVNAGLERRVEERTAALSKSEARYRALFDSMDEGYCIIEMIFDEQDRPVDYRFLEINPSFEKQTGLRDAVGKRMRELAPLHEAYWFEMYGRIAVGGEAAHFQNHAEQLHRWYDVYAYRFGEPKNRQVAILFSDITERKAAEAKITHLNAELQQRAATLEVANKELESFSYSVSHDLRAPLRHVHGYVEMLQRATDGQLSEQAQRYLKTITEASVEMGQLIDDLLAFSRMGRTEMRESRVDVGVLVQETIRDLDMATTGRNIVWQTAPLPAVLGDPSLLKQVLANLVGNAVKYSRMRDPARIEIGCAGEEDGRVVLFVRDNGAGFDMQYAHKLFGVFQRLHRAEEFEGTGIGLATVRRIVTRHGGRVWAEGAVGEGATFYFTLTRSASA